MKIAINRLYNSTFDEKIFLLGKKIEKKPEKFTIFLKCRYLDKWLFNITCIMIGEECFKAKLWSSLVGSPYIGRFNLNLLIYHLLCIISFNSIYLFIKFKAKIGFALYYRSSSCVLCSSTPNNISHPQKWWIIIHRVLKVCRVLAYCMLSQ